MSGLINPHAAPEEAAYALLIELVRAQRVPQYEGEISGLLAMYDEAVKHFKEKITTIPDLPRAPFTAGEDGPCEEPDAPEPYACPSIAGSPNDVTHPPPPKTLLAPGDPRND